MLKRKLSAVAIALAVASPAAFATNGMFSHGYGTKNKGMAGAGVAFAQDSLITATNPAGLVYVGNRIDLGAALFSPKRKYEADDKSFLAGGTGPFGPQQPFAVAEGQSSSSDYFIIPTFGWAKPINDVSSFGIAFTAMVA
ncbi:MAG: hypothetical protein KZQ58_04875 [gamma proteobacterium symbiont of Bathyaustriella thionipta]|nr:hypothetical protein [gamma proteobacterium symbiont of Bathyaustriella thionipta]